MFVLPPPPTSTKQALPALRSKRKGAELAPVPEDSEAKEFVNAPPEFASRARDEIRKRLLNRRPLQSDSHSDTVSLAPSETASTIVSATSDTSSAPSLRSSIFSAHVSLASSATSAAASYIEQEKPKLISLQEALPKVFYDMYASDLLMDPQNLLCNGRPKFTKRELLDWELNDIRSLLIVEALRPEWGFQLPIVHFEPPESSASAIGLPQFRVQLLPLDSPDDFIIRTLVESDLYMEANLDYEFKITSAKYTVAAARKRHEQFTGYHEPVMHLSKPEWRNIIENYLLNIAVEAQCRFDFKKQCSDYKKWKQQQMLVKKPDMPPPSTIPPRKRESSLLKRTLLKNTALKHSEDKPPLPTSKVSLSKEEKAMLWSQCQSRVYQRLGLDWTPDGV